MERFEDGSVVVQLCQWGVQYDQEAVINARVPHVVADGRDQQRQRLEGLQQRRNGRLGLALAGG